jgi:GntR family transcriptional regulator, rspAB operon transcriptional repressor
MQQPELAQITAIKKESITDGVYRALRNLIVSRRISPGQKLTTEEMATRLGVSRSPVQQAFVRLATEGLVVIAPRRGTFVADLSVNDIAETMDVRRALEVLACETAIQRVTPADIEALGRLAEEIESTALQNGDPQEDESRHSASNLVFHQTIVDLSANRVLIAAYQRLNAHMKMARAHFDSWHERIEQERQEHDAIVAALSAKDLPRLQQAVENHIRRSTASLLADISDSEPPR